MASDVKRNERPRAEAEIAPTYAKCPHCGHQPTNRTENHRVVYTTPYPEARLRRVTSQCRQCEGLLWWDEEMG